MSTTETLPDAGVAAPFPVSASARTYLSVLDLTPDGLETCLALAARLKRERGMGADAPTSRALAGHSLALLFDKPSLRTRTGFEIAMQELGGIVTCPPSADALGTREALADVARTLERWIAVAAIRTFQQSRLREIARATTRLRVVNALTNEEHPCQALADCLTLRERFGDMRGAALAYVGDGNNVATSLTHAAAMLGVRLRLASPAGYALPAATVAAARRVTRHGAEIAQCHDPVEAVRGADAVYTDVWISMGDEDETEDRLNAFRGYQVGPHLMDAAGPEAIFMHDMPAHEGEEIAPGMLDHPRSVVFDQAENRLHAQKTILRRLLD